MKEFFSKEENKVPFLPPVQIMKVKQNLKIKTNINIYVNFIKKQKQNTKLIIYHSNCFHIFS